VTIAGREGVGPAGREPRREFAGAGCYVLGGQ
jgi:hypothetical protein